MMQATSGQEFQGRSDQPATARRQRSRSKSTAAKMTWSCAALASAMSLACLALAAPAAPVKPAAKAPAAKAPEAKVPEAKAPAAPQQASAKIPPASASSKPAAPASKPSTQPTTLPSGRYVPKVVPPDPTVLTDEMVELAIRKGALNLLKRFDKDNHVDGVKELLKDGNDSHAGGLDALAVYALMQAGLAVDDPDLSKRLSLKGQEMQAKIAAMMKFNLDKGHQSTYAYGLRSTALALFLNHTPEFDPKSEKGSALAAFKNDVRARLKDDAAWGIMATLDGSYTYVKNPKSPKTAKDLLDYYEKLKKDGKLPVAKGGYDNSNCQYGLLGVWSAADAEIEVPTLYWYLVANHWASKQEGNGTWDYSETKEGRNNPINMTCAGLASMLVTHEYIEPVTLTGAVGREPYNVPIKKGLNWFETGNNGVNVSGGYGTYGVERVGLASGFKFFGQHDWYRELSMKLIKAQKPDGSWGPVVEQSYYLLFLSRGRHPLAMNKLRFDGDTKNPGFWDNRPRDAANVARSIGKQMEKELNWQVINVSTPWTEWLDSPILTLSSHQPFKFTDEQLDKIRNYVEAGGILYTQADGGAASFDKFAHELAVKLFKKELVPVPSDHPIFGMADGVFKIAPPPQLKMVTNGSRILMLHSSADAARYWQTRDDKGKGKPYYQLGINMFMYAVGKTTEPRHRLETLYIADVPAKAPVLSTVGVARLSYPGPWDPEPGAWKRFANWFQWQTSYKLVPTEVKLSEIKPYDPARKNDPTNFRFAHLTGTVKQGWTPDQSAALKAFVESGGVLLVDITGGANAFDQSAQNLIQQTFQGAALTPLADGHPLLTGTGPGTENLTRRELRKIVIEKMGRAYGKPLALTAGKGAVIFSPLDITSGLLGTNTGGIIGYESSYAMKLMKNAVIWSMDGAPNAAPVAAAAPAEPAAAAASTNSEAATPAAAPAEPSAPPATPPAPITPTKK